MNFVPLVFLDAVASTLNELPIFADVKTIHDDLIIWKEAIETQREQTFDVIFAADRHLKCSFRNLSTGKEFDYFSFTELQSSKLRIRQVILQDSLSGKTATTLDSVKKFKKVLDFVRPLAPYPMLKAAMTRYVGYDFLETLGDIDFHELISSDGFESAVLTGAFMEKQLKSSSLKKCSAWPETMSPSLKASVKEFIATQPFLDVQLPTSIYVDSRMFTMIFELPCDPRSARKIGFWVNSSIYSKVKNFNINRQQSKKNYKIVWLRRDNVQVTIDCLRENAIARYYELTLSSLV